VLISAEAAFGFEQTLYDPACGGWRDLRAPRPTTTRWCHGAAGIESPPQTWYAATTATGGAMCYAVPGPRAGRPVSCQPVVRLGSQ